jgi:hypothetical protein
MDDNKIESAIQEARAYVAPRISPEQVNALLSRVDYVTTVPEGTTSTFTHAYLVSKDGKKHFHLATGHSACVSPENFNAQIGADIAISKARQAAKDKLWELLGFNLFMELDK